LGCTDDDKSKQATAESLALCEKIMSGESKKEEFRKYLERSGVIDALTKVPSSMASPVVCALFCEDFVSAQSLNARPSSLAVQQSQPVSSFKNYGQLYCLPAGAGGAAIRRGGGS
jgi:hypothetical protein